MFIITTRPPETPDPTKADCDQLLQYANALVSNLEAVKLHIYGVSEYPDESMILIRGKIDEMLGKAKDVKKQLKSIKEAAVSKTTTI